MMKWTTFLSVTILATIIFESCLPAELMPTLNCTGNFVTYKRAIDARNTHPFLKTNGIYISETGQAAFFLFKNGKVAPHRGGTESPPIPSKEKPEDLINSIQSEWGFNSKNFWGDYEICGDSIFIQVFTHTNEYMCKRYIYETRGRILNDSTIEINSETDTRAKDEYYKGAFRLKFYQTNIKPDSTKPWFNSRKWYQNALHSSRK